MQGGDTASLQPAVLTAVKAVLYVLAMFFVVRPFLRRLQIVYDRQGRLSQNVVAVIFLLVLASACTTEAIGIHALFGAFLMGAIMPKGTQFVRTLSEKLEDFTVVFLLPLFFAYTGPQDADRAARTARRCGSTRSWSSSSRASASSAARRWPRGRAASPWRESAAIGILMNTRGLMELVILNIGRELGVITPAVFAMMVIMALVTTGLDHADAALGLPPPALRRASGRPARPKRGFSVLIPVADPRSGGPLLRLADLLTGKQAGERRIFALAPAAGRSTTTRTAAASQASRRRRCGPLLDYAERNNLPVEPISFVTPRRRRATSPRTADDRRADLVLMGFHKPVFGKTILGGTVHRVLTGTPTDVAIFVDRGFQRRPPRPRALPRRPARLSGAGPGEPHRPQHAGGGHRAARRGAEPSQGQKARRPGGGRPGVRRPLAAAARSVQGRRARVAGRCGDRRGGAADLVVIGVSEEWGLESHLFGWRPERIAQGCPTSLLIVRRGGGNSERTTPAATATPAVDPVPVA